jgi:hypothetical protein
VRGAIRAILSRYLDTDNCYILLTLAATRYVSIEFVMSCLAAAEEMTRSIPSGGAAAASGSDKADTLVKMKKQVLTVAFMIGEGLRAGDERVKDYTDRRDDWVADAEQSPDWAKLVRDALAHPHPSVSDVLGKIRLIEGAGLQVLDDRVYVKTRLDAVLSVETHVLIEEVHLVTPSSMFPDPDAGGVLVDTPGLGDPDVMRMIHTERAVKDSSGIIVFSDHGFTRGNPVTMDTMCDTGVIAELATVKARGGQGRPVLFVFNPENVGMAARAVPAGEPSSVLGGVGPGVDVEANRISYVDNTEGVLVVRIKQLSTGDELSSKIGKGLASSFIRETMAKPIAENTLVVYPSLRRALDTAEMSDEDRRRYIEATNVPALITEIISMHRDGRVLTSASMIPVVELLENLKQAQPNFERTPCLPIPPTVRSVANSLKDKKTQAALGIANAQGIINMVVVPEQLGTETGTVAQARVVGAEEAWADRAAEEIVAQCKDAWKVMRKSLTRKGGAAVPELRDTITRARSGKLFSDAVGPHGRSRLSREVWNLCNGAQALGHGGLWSDVLRPPLKPTLSAIFEAAFAPAILDHPLMKDAIDAAPDFSREDLKRFLLEVRGGPSRA